MKFGLKSIRFPCAVHFWNLEISWIIAMYSIFGGKKVAYPRIALTNCAGGVDTQYLSSVVTIYISNTTVNPLPDLPEENVQSCLVIIDRDRIFTCGGYFQPKDTFIFYKSSNSWRR